MSVMVRVIKPTFGEAMRAARRWPGSRVELGTKGTTPERPWAVVVDRKKEPDR